MQIVMSPTVVKASVIVAVHVAVGVRSRGESPPACEHLPCTVLEINAFYSGCGKPVVRSLKVVVKPVDDVNLPYLDDLGLDDTP